MNEMYKTSSLFSLTLSKMKEAVYFMAIQDWYYGSALLYALAPYTIGINYTFMGFNKNVSSSTSHKKTLSFQ